MVLVTLRWLRKLSLAGYEALPLVTQPEAAGDGAELLVTQASLLVRATKLR